MRTTAASPRLSLNREGFFKTAGSNRQAEAQRESARTRKSKSRNRRSDSDRPSRLAGLGCSRSTASRCWGCCAAAWKCRGPVGRPAGSRPRRLRAAGSPGPPLGPSRTAATRHCQFASGLHDAGGSPEAQPRLCQWIPAWSVRSGISQSLRHPDGPPGFQCPDPESRGAVVVGWRHCRQRTRCRAGLRCGLRSSRRRQLGRC
jgi:hypothetical protein